MGLPTAQQRCVCPDGMRFLSGGGQCTGVPALAAPMLRPARTACREGVEDTGLSAQRRMDCPARRPKSRDLTPGVPYEEDEKVVETLSEYGRPVPTLYLEELEFELAMARCEVGEHSFVPSQRPGTDNAAPQQSH